MAKSKAFFGLRSGSTKSLTFSVYRGQQITKDRVLTPKNPQSASQMAQRLKLVGVANACAQLKGLVDHSFEGIDYGYKSIAEFRKLNLSAKDLKITNYVPKGLVDLGRANYIVAKGSLPELKAYFDNANWDVNNDVVMMNIGKAAIGTNIKITGKQTGQVSSLAATEENTKNLAALFGCEIGAQVTFLVQIFNTEKTIDVYTDNGTSFYDRSFFVIARAITDYTDENFMKGWTVSADATKLNFAAGGISILFDETNEPARFEIPKTASIEGIDSLDTCEACAMAIIQSKKSENTWKRSNARLEPLDPSNAQYAIWSFEKAENTYLKSNGASTLYLNQGNKSVEIIPNE